MFSWSGTLLLDFWAGGDAGLNQHLFKVTSEEYPTWFYYAWTKYHMHKFVALAKDRATTMGHIKRSALAEAKVLIPPSKAFGKLNSQMQPIVDQMINLKVEARELGEFRDSLLPKLMSGEIDVSKIDIMQPANNHLEVCRNRISWRCGEGRGIGIVTSRPLKPAGRKDTGEQPYASAQWKLSVPAPISNW